MSDKTNTYKLYEYELFGGEVNDLRYLDTYSIAEDMTSREILRIVEARRGTRVDDNCCSWPNALYFLNKNGDPVGELRLVSEDV